MPQGPFQEHEMPATSARLKSERPGNQLLEGALVTENSSPQIMPLPRDGTQSTQDNMPKSDKERVEIR